MTTRPEGFWPLVKFLLAGQGMSTWMIQSMSTLASAEMQQQYANEIMKQQILKIHQENKKIESTIELTNTTMASEPPVEEVLAGTSMMTDIETNSGVMVQCHDTMNNEDDDVIDIINPA